jgi:hypothetical protein
LKPLTETMKTDTHTPGPWCIHRGYANAQTMTVTENDGESWEFTDTYIAQGDKIIAKAQHQSKDAGWPAVQNVDEMWANARLIAAAPELLEALQSLTHPMASDEDLQNALAVIAKAEGGDA